MISLVSRTSSIVLLILVLDLVVCQAGRVRRYDDDEYQTLREQRLRERIEKDIEADKRQQRENRRHNEMIEMFGLLIQTIIGIAVIAFMIYIIYRCIKKSRQYEQGKQSFGTEGSLVQNDQKIEKNWFEMNSNQVI